MSNHERARLALARPVAGRARAFFAAFFPAPLAVVALASITGGPEGMTLTLQQYVRVLADQYHWDVILVTFRLAFFTTVVCVILGYPWPGIWCAWCAGRLGGASA